MAADSYRHLIFAFSAAGVQSWTADDDYFLVAAGNTTSGQGTMFTTDPISTITTVLATTRLVTSVLVLFNSAKLFVSGLQIPIQKDKTYYARADGISALQLWMVPQSIDLQLG